MSNTPRAAAPKKPVKKAAATTPTGAVKEDMGYSDELISEIEERLDDAPRVLQLQHLNRRRRANAVTKLEALLPQIPALNKASRGRGGESAILQLLADVEDILVEFAADPDQMREWAQDADDESILALLSRLTKDVLSGEASSSSR